MLELGELSAAAPYTTEHTLPVEENRRVFWDDIVPAELAHAEPPAEPTVVFLVGQQGAGKTRISNQIAQRLDDSGGYVDVDSDLYKPYHPDYQQLLVEDDRVMAHHTRPDSRRWMAQAEAYVRGDRLDGQGNGINALVQETAQEPASVVDKLREYRDTHRVEIAFLGVPEAQSLQGILHRYHEQVTERGYGRLTEPARRELAYNGILEFADQVDQLQLADHVAVFRRGESTPRYANELGTDGRWRSPAGLKEAIQAERDRPWTQQEAADFSRVQDYLKNHMPEEFQEELRSIDELARPLMPAAEQTTPSPAQLSQRGFPAPLDQALGAGETATPNQPSARPQQSHRSDELER